MDRDQAREWKGPIFLLADDDRNAADAIAHRLYPECYYIVQVTNPRHIRNYAKRMNPDAIFLADPIHYPKGGTDLLLQRLIDEIGKPVIILSELWSSEIVMTWKRKGAADCLPHPTRIDQRLDLLRAKMQDLALSSGSKRLVADGSEMRP